jgi:hypothetical protein
MSTIHRSEGFPINIRSKEIARVLGYRSKGMPRRVLALLEEVEQTAVTSELISPACAYRYFRKEELTSSAYLHNLDYLALCLVTIGSRLEEIVEEKKNEGDLSRAIIFDTYGSAAAEACADAAESIISREAEAMGLKCSKRFSPGYSGWDVAEQKWILPALESEALGVSLTEGCMMVPRKSITFAVTIGQDPVEMRKASACDVCGLSDCGYRHDAENHEGEK